MLFQLLVVVDFSALFGAADFTTTVCRTLSSKSLASLFTAKLNLNSPLSGVLEGPATILDDEFFSMTSLLTASSLFLAGGGGRLVVVVAGIVGEYDAAACNFRFR